MLIKKYMMDITQSALTKSQLAETIKATLSLNKLGFVFLKSNARYYYFRRESTRSDAIYFLVVRAYFKRGVIDCELQLRLGETRIDARKHPYNYTLFNKKFPLYNSRSEHHKKTDTGYIYEPNYVFKKSLKSLKTELQVALTDFNKRGKDFIIDCEKQFLQPKFLCAIDFMDNLEIDEDEFKKELTAEVERIKKSRYFTRPVHMLEHPIFQDLVEQLSKVYQDFSGSVVNHNQSFAYAFLFDYYFKVDWRFKSYEGSYSSLSF